MKKIVVLLATALMVFSAAAQMNNHETGRLHREYRKANFSRMPAVREGVKTAPATKMTGAHSTASQLPADRWFPGEWEEVQAIVVTWPYWSVPANWEQLGDQVSYYDATPVFSGYGDIVKYVYSQGSWREQPQGYGAIDQLPYCVNFTVGTDDEETLDFIAVFAHLIDAIRQGGAEPWVRVTHLSDSVYIKQHLQYLGLATTGIKWIEGYGDSFWFRDCGPICFYYGEGDTVGMLDFQYYSGRAIDDSLPQIINAQKNLPVWTTSLEWEGGNCIVDGDGFVMSSNHIYSTNADNSGQLVWAGAGVEPTQYEYKNTLSQQQVRDTLAYLMGPRGAKVLPAFKYDGGTGHVDLYADMIDENSFVFSQFPEAYSSWVDYTTASRNIDSICSWSSTFGHDFKKTYIPFPSKDNGTNFSSQVEYNRSYTRTYSNHTFVNNLIIQPCFSKVVNGVPSAEWDRANIELVKKAYPGYTIYPIDVRTFDGSGGAIHCITKQIPAENPIRILHASITGANEQPRNENVTISARITNRSGIASAKVRYCVANADSWQEVDMQLGADDTWTAEIPTAQMPGNDLTIRYYISATSNNGKSIDKPYTGANGGAYTFWWGTPVGIEQASEAERFGQFYPNPAADVAHIVIDLGKAADYSVSIVDAAGRTVHASRLQASGEIVYTVNTARLHAGLYTVVFQNGSERIARRLVVK